MKINWEKIGQKVTQGLWIVFLVSLFFPKRFEAFELTEGVQAQTVSFLNWYYYYGEVLLPLILLGVLLFFRSEGKLRIPKLWTAGLVILAVGAVVGLGLHMQPNFDAAILVRVLELGVVSYLITRNLIRRRTLIGVMLLAILFQAGLGLAQFGLQHSLGWSVIGEPVLSPETLGIAKIDSLGEKFIRPTGTLVHANAWGFLMLVGLMLLPLFYASLEEEKLKISLEKAKRKWEEKSIRYSVWALGAVFSVCAVLSFARAAWVGLGLLLVGGVLHYRRKKWLLGGAGVVAIGSGLYAWQLLWQRVSDWQEAFASRTELWSMAVDLIQKQPLGVGAGRFILEAREMSGRVLAPWEMMPVHNVYLLWGAELGVLVLVGLGAIGLLYLRAAWRKGVLAVCGLLAIIVSLSVDHFLWTDFAMLFALGVLAAMWETGRRED